MVLELKLRKVDHSVGGRWQSGRGLVSIRLVNIADSHHFAVRVGGKNRRHVGATNPGADRPHANPVVGANGGAGQGGSQAGTHQERTAACHTRGLSARECGLARFYHSV